MKAYFALIVASILTLALSAQSSPPALPTAYGLYVLVDETYQPMLPAPIQSVQPKIGRAILNAYSLGLAGNRVVITIPGNTSLIQTGVRPTFLLVNTSSAIASSVQTGSLNPRALEIVKLDRKKNHRESNIMHGTSWNPSIGLPDAKWPFIITPIGDSIYQFTLASDIPPGEYIVLSGMFASGYNGFDFTASKVIRERDTGKTEAAVVSTPPKAENRDRISSGSSRGANGNVPVDTSTEGEISNRTPSVFGKSQDGVVLLGLAVTDWEDGGVQIVKIASASPAEVAGLHVGDVINFVDGKPVRSAPDLTAALANRPLGSKVRLGYMFHTNVLGWMQGTEKVLTLHE
jgi:hypothetical protein